MSYGFRLPGRHGPPTPAAGLLPLVNRPEPACAPDPRSADLPDHAGQIIFPGGRWKPTIPTTVAAALR